MKRKFIFFVIGLAVSQFSVCQQTTGTVCVASRADDPFWKEPPTSNGQISTHGLRLQVDHRPVTEWPVRQSLKVEELETGRRHLLVVRESNGKPIESVRFTFSQYASTNLCMFYDGYQGIQLQEASRHTPWCKCK